MNETGRDPRIVLAEMTPVLSLLATQKLYAEQPELWKLGERGRARTIEDFNHHFRTLTSLEATVFRGHVQYCEQLFASRGFTHQWLDDAWRWMRVVIEQELPPSAAQQALSVMDGGLLSPKDVG